MTQPPPAAAGREGGGGWLQKDGGRVRDVARGTGRPEPVRLYGKRPERRGERDDDEGDEDERDDFAVHCELASNPTSPPPPRR